VRIGTRASALALAQAGTVAELLGEDTQLVAVTTSGDRDRDRGGTPTPSGEQDTQEAQPTQGAQDKERWVKELELALLAGEIDLAIHSAKDVPSALPEGLELVGAPERGNPFDVLVGAGSLAGVAEAIGGAVLAYRDGAALLSTTELRAPMFEHISQAAAELAVVRGLLGEEPSPFAFVTGGTEEPYEDTDFDATEDE